MSADYSDDRPGMMRVHVAYERANLAGSRYTRAELREHARRHGVSSAYGLKSTLAWFMAQQGLIDAEGNLRDGFPDAGGAS